LRDLTTVNIICSGSPRSLAITPAHLNPSFKW
jgi:hypothetical protein